MENVPGSDLFWSFFFWEIFGRSFSEWKPMSNFLLLDENEIH